MQDSLVVFMLLQQLRGSRNFRERVFYLKGLKLVLVCDQRTSRKVPLLDATWWPLNKMLDCFCCNLSNRASK